jgi:SAM-dependent methyltransferase
VDGTWVDTACCLCNETAGRTVLPISHPDAPNGRTRIVECSGCGLRRLDPRPGQDAIGRYYGDDYNAFVGRDRGRAKQALWDLMRDAWARPPRRRGRMLRPVLAPLAAWAFDINVPLDTGFPLRVVEMGSGFGDLLIYLKARGCDVHGVDLDARAATRAADYGVPVRLGDLASAGFPSESFDVGIMCHSLEHVPDPVAEVREFARILKPGGSLHIAVPNGRALGLELYGTDWMHLSLPLHFWFFDAKTLTHLLERLGFSISRPPVSVSRTYYLSRWLRDIRDHGTLEATRTFARHLRCSLSERGRGDVLRIVASRGSQRREDVP